MNHSASHKNEKLCLNLAAKFENIFYKRSISFDFVTRSLKFGQRKEKLKINQFCSCDFFNIASRKWFIHIKWWTKVHCFRWITCFLSINVKDSFEQKLFIIMSPMRVQIFKPLASTGAEVMKWRTGAEVKEQAFFYKPTNF